MNGPRPQQSPPLDLLALTRRELDIFDAGYLSGCTAGLQMGLARGGYTAGHRDGWRDRIAHDATTWRVMADIVRRMASAPTYAELLERRRRLPAGYVPRQVPSPAECMTSWSSTGHQGPP